MLFWICTTLVLALSLGTNAQESLEALDLKDFTGAQSLDRGVLVDKGGSTYSLGGLQPYTDLFSPNTFEVAEDGLSVKHKLTQESFEIQVFRSTFPDSTVVQAIKDQTGVVQFAEIRGPNATSDTFFVNGQLVADDLVFEAGSDPADVVLSFTAEDFDQEKLSRTFEFGDAIPPREAVAFPLLLDNSTVPSMQPAGAKCNSFQAIDVAVVYDSEFCGKYGSRAKTAARITSIVASASVHYERDMCVKLKLADMYTPDSACGGTSKSFSGFNKKVVCGGADSMLGDFSTWMAARRNSAKIGGNTLVHLFTGVKPSSTIGCAWTGTLCWARYAFGIEFLTFTNNVFTQALTFAHEVGHNLNARHKTDTTGKSNFIMEAKISSGADGFSATSVSTILKFLSSVSCDYKVSAPSKPAPSPLAQPVAPPVRVPTKSPPVPAPTRDVEKCPDNTGLPACVGAGAKSTFACVSIKKLVPPDCPKQNLRFTLASCDGIAPPKNSRLLGRSSKSEKASIDDNSTNPDSTAAKNKEKKHYKCSDTCIILATHVCFDARNDHTLVFNGLNKNGRRVARVTKKVPVKNANSCIAAKVPCN